MSEIALVCGNLSRKRNSFNGQTIKTRNIANILRELDFIVDELDTDISLLKFLLLLPSLFKRIRDASKIIVLPGKKALFSVFIPIYLLSKLYKKPIVYVVIGGWLPQFIKRKYFMQNALKSLSAILIESHAMVKALETYGFSNVTYYPNFKKLELQHDIDIIKYSEKDKLKCVFISRMIKEKGIYIILDAVKKLKNDYNLIVDVDFYGPFNNSDDEELFKNEIVSLSSVSYNGIIDFNKSGNGLHGYDFMLFPTFYSGEGFPGIFIDAFFYGIYVLASNWKYNAEIITMSGGGEVFEPKSVDALVLKLVEVNRQIENIQTLKQKSYMAKENYTFTKAKATLAGFVK